MSAEIELRSNPSSPRHYDKDEMGILRKRSSGRLQKVGSASTWPSMTKASSILPTYNHIFTLFATLLLSTALAFFSALDAAVNCTKGTNVWSHSWFKYEAQEDPKQYYDDDFNRRLEEVAENEDYYNGYGYQYQNQAKNYDVDDDVDVDSSEAQKCKYLFTSAILTVCPAVVILCFVSFRWTQSQKWKAATSPGTTTEPRAKLDSGDFNRFKEFQNHVTHQTRHLKNCFEVFFISLVCTALWVYAMAMIAHDSDFPFVDEEEEKNLFTQKFQSLGAIDYTGDVGQNANLYYSSWISLLVSFALVYELGRITHKQYLVTKDLEMEWARLSRYTTTETNAVETIMTWSKSQQQMIKDNRTACHESLYKLRFRTGIWLTTLIASAILYQSSQRVWDNSIYPNAEANGEVNDDGSLCTITHGYLSLDSLNDLGFIQPSMCERTKAARATGVLCTALSILALFAHYRMHTQVAQEIKSSSKLLHNRTALPQLLENAGKVIPLRFECLFACVMSIFLAINAIFATAVEGPAAKVGNLYYSSWIAFISSMRLALNCLEDMLEQDEIESGGNNQVGDLWYDDYQTRQAVETKNRRSNMTRMFSLHTNFEIREKVSTRLIMLAATKSSEKGNDDGILGSYIGGMPIPQQNSFQQMFEERIVEEEEASRAKRARRWASGGIFSTIYLMSVLDAVSRLLLWCANRYNITYHTNNLLTS